MLRSFLTGSDASRHIFQQRCPKHCLFEKPLALVLFLRSLHLQLKKKKKLSIRALESRAFCQKLLFHDDPQRPFYKHVLTKDRFGREIRELLGATGKTSHCQQLSIHSPSYIVLHIRHVLKHFSFELLYQTPFILLALYELANNNNGFDDSHILDTDIHALIWSLEISFHAEWCDCRSIRGMKYSASLSLVIPLPEPMKVCSLHPNARSPLSSGCQESCVEMIERSN